MGNLRLLGSLLPDQIIQQERPVKKIILVTACVAAISGFTVLSASAQTPSPAGKDSTSDNMSKDKMGQNGMKKDGMKKDGMETTGMKKEGMSKDVAKDGSSKADTMKKDGMTK
jgi:pentapeptide MXKDX repeat protein